MNYQATVPGVIKLETIHKSLLLGEYIHSHLKNQIL